MSVVTKTTRFGEHGIGSCRARTTMDRSATSAGEQSRVGLKLASERTPGSSQGWLTLSMKARSGELSTVVESSPLDTNGNTGICGSFQLAARHGRL